MKFTEICYHCKREYVACEMRICPVKQKSICRYCCMKCGKHTKIETGIGCEMIGEQHEK